MNKWVWLYSNYILFIKVHSRLGLAHRLWFASSSTEESNNWGEKSNCTESMDICKILLNSSLSYSILHANGLFSS